LSKIEIDPANPYFTLALDFLIQRHPSISIIRYFGDNSHIVIHASIEIIGSSCFESCRSITQVDFDSPSRVRLIRRRAFRFCTQLGLICVPSSVECLRPECFQDCRDLCAVTFAPGSNLRKLPRAAFDDCYRLRQLIIPTSIEVVGRGCFTSCERLASVTFESPSNLKRIEDCAFRECARLKSLAIPSSVEFVGDLCFENCGRLTDFTIESPSHLVELRSLPRDVADLIEVPDSVEVLHWLRPSRVCQKDDRLATLDFGRESRLEAITVTWRTPVSMKRRSARAFERLSTAALKRLRSNHEFSGDDRDRACYSDFKTLMSVPDDESDVSDD
jgi:hypothetical protein